MKAKSWLEKSALVLKSQSQTAQLDSEVLLSYVLKKEREWVLAHPEHELTKLQLSSLVKLIKRRQSHEPIAYILGKCEFYGRQFLVDRNVLVPRPESEIMIDLLKKHLSSKSKIIDVGTGSGALAITAKLAIPSSEVIAVDVDTKCLAVARKNAKTNKVKVRFLRSDLLSGFAIDKPMVILANLPYVPKEYPVNNAAKHEPKLALLGGNDGLDLYRKLFDQLKGAGATVFTESLPFQHAKLQQIAEKAGFEQTDEQDLIQVFRGRYTAIPKRVPQPRSLAP